MSYRIARDAAAALILVAVAFTLGAASPIGDGPDAEAIACADQVMSDLGNWGQYAAPGELRPQPVYHVLVSECARYGYEDTAAGFGVLG